MAKPATDEQLALEMDYTSLHDSCLDPAILPNGDGRQCRRSRGHAHRGDLDHASGREDALVRWR